MKEGRKEERKEGRKEDEGRKEGKKMKEGRNQMMYSNYLSNMKQTRLKTKAQTGMD